jgi:hypothetical protein
MIRVVKLAMEVIHVSDGVLKVRVWGYTLLFKYSPRKESVDVRDSSDSYDEEGPCLVKRKGALDKIFQGVRL